MFYGYNPFYLVAFLFVWCYSLEQLGQNLVQSYLDILGYPILMGPDYLPISQGIDWS